MRPCFSGSGRGLAAVSVVSAPRGGQTAHRTLRWRGGLLTELDIDRPQTRHAPIRTDEDTVELVRRLARHYPDAVIAGILSRQGKKTAYGHAFTAMHVGNVRRRWNLGCSARQRVRPRVSWSASRKRPAAWTWRRRRWGCPVRC